MAPYEAQSEHLNLNLDDSYIALRVHYISDLFFLFFSPNLKERNSTISWQTRICSRKKEEPYVFNRVGTGEEKERKSEKKLFGQWKKRRRGKIRSVCDLTWSFSTSPYWSLQQEFSSKKMQLISSWFGKNLTQTTGCYRRPILKGCWLESTLNLTMIYSGLFLQLPSGKKVAKNGDYCAVFARKSRKRKEKIPQAKTVWAFFLGKIETARKEQLRMRWRTTGQKRRRLFQAALKLL